MTQKWYMTLCHQKLHPHTKFGILTFNNIRYSPDTIFLKTRSEVKVTVTHKMVQDTPSSQDAFIHQNWDSYLKQYKRYAPDTIIIKTRSEVKVTVTQKW